ncbi:MAG: carboxypeptidase regulatory-like domain-containing protein [Bacteroidetes bacterium]|nr:carboxypeptidase regulatory-like domain-containing protein [Bacteroidota bacterium]
MKARIITMSLVFTMIIAVTQTAAGQIITTAPNLTACPGTTISVPVTVINFTGVASISITLGINPASLSYTGYTLNSGLAGGFPVINCPYPYTKVIFAWFSLSTASLANGSTLMTLNFNYSGGNCPLEFDLINNGACLYSNINGDVMPASWINGSVTQGLSPVIASQPLPANVYAGNNAGFTVSATNATSYQWQESTNGSNWNSINNGGIYAGANTNNLVISNVTLGMNGYQYRCFLGGTVCSPGITSDPATLNVAAPLTTTNIPDVTACAGSTLSLPITVDYFNDIASISLTVNLDPAILTYTGYTLNPALTGGFTVVNSPAPYTQVILAWFSLLPATLPQGSVLVTFNFTYTGGSMPLTFDQVSAGACLYSNIYGEILPAVWNNGSISPSASAPSISTHPSDAAVSAGLSASFSCTANNATSYQWQESTDGNSWTILNDGGIYSGVSTNHLVISTVNIGMNNYRYRCRVSETLCNQMALSNPATLSVTTPDIIVTAPDITACLGSTLSVPIIVDNFTGVGSISLTLNFDPAVMTFTSFSLNSGLSGGFFVINSPSPFSQVLFTWYSFSAVTLPSNSTLMTINFNYTGGSCPLVFDNAEGNCMFYDVNTYPFPSTWNNGSVSQGLSPLINTQPSPVMVYTGGNASFSVSVANASTFQWQESTNGSTWTYLTNNSTYSGTTSNNLIINNITLGVNGYQYRCLATGTDCTQAIFSNPATLTVVIPSSVIQTYIEPVAACEPGPVSIPVKVNNFLGVSSISMTLNIDSAVLVYTGNTLNPGLSGGFPVIYSPYPYTQVLFAWFSLSTATLGPGSTLITLNFNYSGGSCPLVFDTITNGASLYSNINGDPIPGYWTNGSINQIPVPFITDQPQSANVDEGSNTGFTVSATNASAYQWQVSPEGSYWSNINNGDIYSGTNTNNLIINNVPYGLNGFHYRCTAIETICNKFTQSDAATLTVTPLSIEITTTIGSVTTCPNPDGSVVVTIPVNVTNFFNVASATFKILYDTLSLVYDTTSNFNSFIDPIQGSGIFFAAANNGSYGMAWFSVTPANIGNGKLFDIHFHYVANHSSLVFDTSNFTSSYTDINFYNLPAVWVNGSVSLPGPVITTMPVNQIAIEGTSAVFTLNGNNIDSYQWQRLVGGNWTDLSDGSGYTGVNTGSLTVISVTPGMDQSSFRCMVNGVCGPQYSHTAVLTVLNSPVSVSLPSITQCQGPIVIPVSVANFTQAGSFNLVFNTTGNTLVYNGFQNINPDLTGMTITQSNNSVILSFTSIIPVTISDGVIVELKFNTNPGFTILTWNPEPGVNFFKSVTGNMLSSTFNSGYVIINPYPGPPVPIQGSSSVCQDVVSSSYTTAGASNASSYLWGLIPSIAGTITGTGVTAAIYWDPTWSGLATVTVKGVNSCGNGPVMSKAVMVNDLPAVTWSDVLPVQCNYSAGLALTGGLPAGGTYSGTGVNSSTGFFTPDLAPDVYILYYTYQQPTNGCFGTATNTITVLASPVLEITQQAVSQTVDVGTNASFTVAVTNATTFIWQVSIDGGNTWSDLTDGPNYSGTTTANLQIINTSLSYTGYQYRCIAGAQPCGAGITSDAALLTVTGPGSTINGTVKYDNTAGTPMWNATVELKQGTTVVMSDITDNGGFYEFANVPAGTYMLKVTPFHPWGGVNNTDALIILRKYMGVVTLTGLKLKVGDVNGNGYINTTDALITQLRFMGTSNLMYADWYFESPQVTVGNPSTQTFNIRGLCIGDVNASYDPAVQGFTNCGDQLTDIRDGKKYNTVQIGWDEMMQYSQTPGIKGICPTNWHVPTNQEWTTLTDYLGGLDLAGGKMKEAGIAHWNSPNSGASNESGFTALAGGRRNGESATFNDFGGSASFWSSSAFSSASAWYRMLHSSDAIVNQFNSNELQDGFSVRCVKNCSTLTTSDAGPDQPDVTGTTATLVGNTPAQGESGKWSIISGDAGSLDDSNNPTSSFTGISGSSYTLQWTISNGCGSSSSDEVIISFQAAVSNPCPGIPSFDYGGQTYNTVQIGPQCWMKDNLNIGTMIDGSVSQVNNGIIEKYCLNNDPANCLIYGGYYQWNEMMKYSTAPGLQGICPSGWHLPTDAEWCMLSQYIDPLVNCTAWGYSGIDAAGKMKEPGYTHWLSPNTGATNSSGFTILGAGSHYNGGYNDFKEDAHFWTSTAYTSDSAYQRRFDNTHSSIYRFAYAKTDGFTVRCLKDTCNQSPTTSNAGPDQTITGTSAILAANTPQSGLGLWSILSGEGRSITQSGNPVSVFTGNAGTTYFLTWTISTACAGSTDTVSITFNYLPLGSPCPGNSSFVYGGQTYHAVQIGPQCWMKENLNIGTMIQANQNQTDNGTKEKYCYNNNPANCLVYGGLYQWEEMMQYSITAGAQGICPVGWHLPTDAEWCTLTTFLDLTVDCNVWNWSGINAANMLKETGTAHWNSSISATNESGFTALGGGITENGGYFYSIGDYAIFWSSSDYHESSWDYGIYWEVMAYSPNVGRGVNHIMAGSSVRCIRNP